MVKTTITETTETFDKEGNLVERVIREETTEDDTEYVPYYSKPCEPVTVPFNNPLGHTYCQTDAACHSDT